MHLGGYRVYNKQKFFFWISMQLNVEQDQAVKYIDSPLLVLAGAGSGKTRVITQKIVYLIEECGYKANSVYAVTFTNKAAREMKERVSGVLHKRLRRGLVVSTFHNLCLRILRSRPEAFELKSRFSIFDADDAYSLIQQLLDRKYSRDKEFVQQVQSIISNWKNDMKFPEDVIKLPLDNVIEQTAASIYGEYNSHLRTYNAVDFDDLILLPVKYFLKNAELLSMWQNKIRYLLVDEYQDTNATQYLLVKLLVGVRAAFTVVGDDDQSIYAWRGADPKNLGLLKTDFPALRLIKLEQNYRSSSCILKAANHLIANNPHVFKKKLWSQHGLGELIKVIYTNDEFHEADQVAAEIISHKIKNNSEFKDYAVLFRGNHQSRLFEKSFRAQSIPYQVNGGTSFFSKTEVKDIFCYMRLICNFTDDNAFLRIINTPKRGIGQATIEKLVNYAHSRDISLLKASGEIGLKELLTETAYEKLYTFNKWLHAKAQKLESATAVIPILKELVYDINYETHVFEFCETSAQAEKRIANIDDLIVWVDRLMHKDPEQVLSFPDVITKLILIDIMDRGEDETLDQVQFMTLHASKGLEYPFVYLVGMEEEILPHRTSIEEDNIEEERRLAYVGITRAQRELVITLAEKRRRYGDVADCVPSRFLEELPEELLSIEGGKKQAPNKEKATSHLSALKAMLGTNKKADN